jgi:hypothetical protein
MDPDVPPSDDFEGKLEQSLIDEYLRTRGYDAVRLASLTDEQRATVRRDACKYADLRLAEIESRAQYLKALHHEE